jgi:hypothetical protein
MELFVYSADFLPEWMRPGNALLDDPAIGFSVKNGNVYHRQGRDVAEKLVILADHIPSSHDEANFRIGGEAAG